MNAQKNLLALSKNALQLCHDVYGMDFKKPYTIIEGCGKFTANSIGKLVSEKTGLTYKDAITVFFMENTNKYRSEYEKIRFVKFANTFEPVDTMKGLRGRSYRCIDDYWRKSDFESDRKKGDARYWIVVQDKKYLASGKTYIADFANERFTYDYGDYYCLMFDSRKEIKYATLWYGRNKPSKGDILDKSGYIRWENVIEYQRKARALKTERNKTAANAVDCSMENIKIEQAIKTIRTRIAEKVVNGANAYDLYHIFLMIANLERCYKIHKEKITEKSYNSVENIQYELNNLNERIVNINNKLDEL